VPEDAARVLEPFAGSAAVSIAARYMGIGATACISDIDSSLMALWDAILRSPETLADDYAQLWENQLKDPAGFYRATRARFNESGDPHLLLYLLSRCVKAAVRYNRNGDFNQAADNRRLGARPETVRSRLCMTSQTLAEVSIATSDYADVLATASRLDVVYMDPPYEGVTGSRDPRYASGLERSKLVAQLQAAVEQDVSFILSYDGASGPKTYGSPLPAELGLLHLRVKAGRSSQATLHGRVVETLESLYIAPALTRRLGGERAVTALLAE
jgi:DNA adenine methylase